MNIDRLLNTDGTIQVLTKTFSATSGQTIRTWVNEEITITGEILGTGDDSTVIFNTDRNAVSEITKVYVNEVEQTEGVDYNVTDLDDVSNPATITFGTAPGLGLSVTCDYKHKDSDQVRGRKDMAGAGEIRIPQDLMNKATHTWYMGYKSGVTVLGHRIVHDSKNYNILRVSDAGGMQHHLEIVLELIT